MGDLADQASAVYRDYVTDGIPASGKHRPVKSDIRALWGGAESAFAASSHGHPELRRYAASQFGISTSLTDNGPAIQDAIDFIASAGGGTLVFGPGTFKVAQSTDGETGVHIEGAGPYKTIIETPQINQTNTIGNHIFSYENKQEFSVRNIAVRGSRAAQTTAPPGTICGFNFGGCSNFEVDNVRAFDIEDSGFLISYIVPTGGSTNFTLRRCKVYNAKHGIFAFKGAGYGSIVDCEIDSVDGLGIVADDATAADVTAATSVACVDLHISRNRVSRWSRTGGGSAAILASGMSGGSIVNNRLFNGGTSSKSANGIVLNSGNDAYNATDGVPVIGNFIDTVYGGGGIALQGAVNCAVIGNRMANLNLWPTVFYGQAIYLLPDVGPSPKGTSGNIIEGNFASGGGNSVYAFHIANGCTNNCIGDNNFLAFTYPFITANTLQTGQFQFIGRGTLPAYQAALDGMLWVNPANGKLVQAVTGIGWQTVGQQ